MSNTRVLVLAFFSLCGGFLSSSNSAQAQPYPGESLPWDARQQYYEQIPTDRGGLYNESTSPLDRFLYQVGEQSWFQIDYMLWDFDSPDNRLIGTRTVNFPRPDLGFTTTDSATGAPPLSTDDNLQTTYAVRANEIDLGALNGLKLKYGLSTTAGDFEASTFWILQTTRTERPGQFFVFQGDTLFNGAPIAGSGTSRFTTRIPDVDGVAAIPFTINGSLSNQSLVFDQDFVLNYDSQMFGAEFNFVFDDHKPANGFHYYHMLGFRYINLTEKLNIFGSDQQVVTDDSGNDVFFVKNTTIDSKTVNNVFGPQFACRLELVADKLVLGAQPGFTFAFNQSNARVTTDDLFSADNPLTPDIDESTPTTADEDSQNHIVPILSLNLYTKIRVTQNFQFYASYDAMYLNGITRPANNIVYNQEIGVVDAFPGFRVAPEHINMFNQGFSVGTILEF